MSQETSALSSQQIRTLFAALNAELARRRVTGELCLVGGAVMCLVYNARESTRDIDAVFEPKAVIYEAARAVADQEKVEEAWLNDAVKGFLGDRAAFVPFLEFSHLRIFVACPEYLLAMKCLSLRLGPEFSDEDDVRFLLRFLNIESFDAAKRTIAAYYPLDQFPQKTFYALQELLPKHSPKKARTDRR